MIFGVDVSNHQTSFDFSGWDFAFIKSSEGSGFRDSRFDQHSTRARQQGCLIAAYHFLRSDAGVADQVATVRSLVPLDTPVIPDVEWIKNGSAIVSAPTLGQTVDFVNRLRAEGYSVPLLYLPRWYWNYWRNPNMSGLGLPPLWNSWYPDYTARPREEAVRLVPASAWSGFGGLEVAVMQFTSTPFDQNGFKGTRDELSALLGGKEMEAGEMEGIFQSDDQPDPDKQWCVSSDGINCTKRHISIGAEAELWNSVGITAKKVPWAVLSAIPDYQSAAEFSLKKELSDQISGVAANQSTLHKAFTDMQISLLKAIREIPAGPSGEIDYDQVEERVRAVFRTGTEGPVVTNTKE